MYTYTDIEREKEQERGKQVRLTINLGESQ